MSDAVIALGITSLVFLILLWKRGVPTDLVFLAGLVAVTLCGVISPRDALVGFANPAVVTIASLYVVAAGLRQTGALDLIGHKLLGDIRTEKGALLRLMLPIVGLSALINNTPIVAMTVMVDGQPVELSEEGRVTFVPDRTGLIEIFVTVIDANGQTAETTAIVKVRDASDEDAPLVTFALGLDGARLSAPTDILATVKDINPDEWIIERAPVGYGSFVEIARDWTQPYRIACARRLTTRRRNLSTRVAPTLQ